MRETLPLATIHEAARAFAIDETIRFNTRVARATWNSAEALWTLETSLNGQPRTYWCRFLYTCTGYYDYAAGYTPDWPQVDRFRGRLVHPQQWPEDLDYAGKRVVVVGSGATAVTLVPQLAKTASHVTMLQRSPTYVVSLPATDRIARRLNARLPARLAHALVRWKNVFIGMYFYTLARKRPQRVKRAIVALAQRTLGADFDVATHFTPRYAPWDQRLCLIPDGDLFTAIRSGRASMVTDTIETFTETGLRLSSGTELTADIIVTATGLRLQLLGGMEIVVDGTTIDLAKTLTYKGMMYSDIPNLASAFGYTNASWTLKCELTAQYVCRLLNYMDAHGYVRCTPRRDGAVDEAPTVPLTSGYVQRARDVLPKQGSRSPWKIHQNYLLDVAAFRFSSLTDRAMEFAKR